MPSKPSNFRRREHWILKQSVAASGFVHQYTGGMTDGLHQQQG